MVSVLLFACPAVVLGDDAPGHFVAFADFVMQPTSSGNIASRIDAAAEKYQQYAPIPRIGFYDIAWPSSEAELAALNGHGVVLVTVLTQDAKEVPLSRVYGRVDGVEVPLQQIAAVSTIQDSSKPSSRVFGPYRWDALYVLPVYLESRSARIEADFAANRTGFVLGILSVERASTHGYSSAGLEVPTKAPNREEIVKFILREFPGAAVGKPNTR
jgi:hypothetical protein